MLQILSKMMYRTCLSYTPSAFAKIIGSVFSDQLTLSSSSSRYQFRNFFVLSNGCLFNSTHQVLAATDNYHVPIEKSNEMIYFWEDYTKKSTFKRRCINKVAKILDCNEKYASELLTEHQLLFLEDIDNTLENIRLLQENDVSPDIIKNNIWLLYYDHHELHSRIEAMKSWNLKTCSVGDLLNLFKLAYSDFKNVSEMFESEKENAPYGNRIVCLAALLHVSISEMTRHLVRHKYLLVRKLDAIIASIKSFKDFGVSEKELIRDLWALRYTSDVIENRLKIFKEHGFLHLKPYFVRCSAENFEKMLKANDIEKSILHPFLTREEYLSNKLGIDLPVMKQEVKTKRILQNVNIVKLAEMVNYLKHIGFSGTDICACARIFCFSLENTIERVNELKDIGVERLSIGMLIKNEKDYQKLYAQIAYVNNLKKNRKNNT